MDINEFSFDKVLKDNGESVVTEEQKEKVSTEEDKELLEAQKALDKLKEPANQEDVAEIPPLAKLLKEEGYIEELPEEINDEVELLDKAIEAKIYSMLEDLPEEVRQLNRYVLEGGDINEYLKLLKEESQFDFTPDMMENPENQKKIVEMYLKREGYEDDFIKDQLAFLEDSKKLATFSQKYFEKYKKEQEERKALLIREAEQRKKIEQQEILNNMEVIKETIEKEEFIIPISKSDKDVLPKYIYKRNIKIGPGNYISQMHKDLYEVLQDPKKTVILAKLLKGKLDLKDIIKVAETKVTNKIEDNLTRKTTKRGRTQGKSLADYLLD